MAFPNYTELVATTIERRSKRVADNVTANNALLSRLNARGNIRPFSGGTKILEELSFAENSNAGWYSGYDLLPVGVSDVLSAAEFDIKQAACPVVCSGLERLQNAGPERMIDLFSSRLKVAESSMMNLLSDGLYSDGTGSAGKQVDGLDAAIQSTGTYGSIDQSSWAFWASYEPAATDITAANIQQNMNAAWARLNRGADRPDLIVMDNGFWELYVASLQAQQRFNSPTTGDAGFASLKFFDADVVLDGGMYNAAHGAGTLPQMTGTGLYDGTNPGTCLMLNTRYLHWRPHRARNMVPLSPNRRYATNQDADVQILAWAGNLTCSGRQFHARIVDNA